MLALTLGIGGTTAAFSIINAVLLKPAPFPEPERLVILMLSANRNPLIPASSPAQFVYFQVQADVLEDVAAFTNTALNYTSAEFPEQVSVTPVSEAYFRAFRAPIVEGRSFTVDEDLPGGARATVVSHDF